MVHYDITYTCGHDARVNITGSHRLRESRLAFLKGGECFDCYKKQATAVAQVQAHELELPALTEGSEAQIAWAETLRIAKMHEIEVEVERLDPSLPTYRQVLAAVEAITSETSARQWIEWRGKDPRQILSSVYHVLLATPTAEQKQAKIAAQERAEAVKRAALVEATIRPEETVCEHVAEMTLNRQEKTIAVSLPHRQEGFRELVYPLGYVWEHGQWARTIDAYAGPVEDRFVELGRTLLAHGFPVRIFDEDLRARVVAGIYAPEQTRRITTLTSGAYVGWLAIKWGRSEDYYQAARAIQGSRYARPFVVVPSEQFAHVLDFAQTYDFCVNSGAQRLIDQARSDKESMLVVSTAPVAPREKRIPVGEIPPVLEVPALVELADELRDEEA